MPEIKSNSIGRYLKRIKVVLREATVRTCVFVCLSLSVCVSVCLSVCRMFFRSRQRPQKRIDFILFWTNCSGKRTVYVRADKYRVIFCGAQS
jgi:hypothetical protein